MIVSERMRGLRRAEASEGLRRLLRKARADAWDDAVDRAFALGYVDEAQAAILKARNPHGGCFR